MQKLLVPSPFWLKNCLYDYRFNSQGRCPAPLYWSVRARTSLGGIVLEQWWLWAWPWLDVQGHLSSLLSPVGIVLLGLACASPRHPWTPTLKQMIFCCRLLCCGSSCLTVRLMALAVVCRVLGGKLWRLYRLRSHWPADFPFTFAVMACGGQRWLHHSILCTATFSG